MKTTLIRPEEKISEIKFPCLMQSNMAEKEIVVLFSRPEWGTVVVSKELRYKVGDYGDDWEMAAFSTLPTGTKIIIEQE